MVFRDAIKRVGRGIVSAAGEGGSLQVSAESPGGGPRDNEGRCYEEDGRAMVQFLEATDSETGLGGNIFA